MNRSSKEKALNWLSSNNVDEITKSEIKKIIHNPEELEEAFLRDLDFGTGGLRGIMGVGTSRINPYTLGKATQGFSNYLKKHFPGAINVAIAYDSRINSRAYARTVAEIFSANGIHVYLFDELRPTPVLSFAVRHLKCHGGIVLTASHNPKEFNGFKVYNEHGGQLTTPLDQEVIEEVNAVSIDQILFNKKESFIQSVGKEVDEAYLKAILQNNAAVEKTDSKNDLSVVYTPLHGSGWKLVPEALHRIGIQYVHSVKEQNEPDGNFPTVSYPNPEEEAAMSLAIGLAREKNAHLILATDPDADRVGAVAKTKEGAYELLNGNQLFTLISYYILQTRKKEGLKGNEFIAKTIVTSDIIHEIANDFGVKCYDTLTGFKYIAELIQQKETQEQFICGGEESYGYLIGDEVRDKDAVASCAMISEIATWAHQQNLSLIDILNNIYQQYGLYYETLVSTTLKGLKGMEQIKEIMEGFRNDIPAHFGQSPVTTILDYATSMCTQVGSDSSIIHLPKSNVLQFITEEGSKISVRPSGTEPKIKFYIAVKTNDTENLAVAKKHLTEKSERIKRELTTLVELG